MFTLSKHCMAFGKLRGLSWALVYANAGLAGRQCPLVVKWPNCMASDPSPVAVVRSTANWGLKTTQPYSLPSSRGQKYNIKVLTGPCSLSGLQQRILPCLLLPTILGVLWFVATAFQSLPLFPCACLCLLPFLSRYQSLDLGPSLI